jgi:hypothetical protein
LKPHDFDKPSIVPSDAEGLPALRDIQQMRCYRWDSYTAALRLLDKLGRIVRDLRRIHDIEPLPFRVKKVDFANAHWRPFGFDYPQSGGFNFERFG